VDWRTLLQLGDDDGWKPELRLDLRQNRNLTLVLPEKAGAEVDLGKALEPGSWHHLALAWEGAHLDLFVDGRKVLSTDKLPQRDRWGQLTLGGVPANTSPATRADAVFDEFAGRFGPQRSCSGRSR
jgi:hypothetical protein